MRRTMTACLLALLAAAAPLSATETEAYYHYARGLAAAQAGDTAFALEEYTRAVDLDSNAAAVYKDIAATYWQAGNTAAALDAAENLSTAGSNDLDTQLFLGNFYMMAGRPLLARVAWEQALAIDPTNEPAMLYLAAFHSSSETPEKAVDYWNRYIAQKPASPEGYFQLGVVQQKTGNSAAAEASFRKAISLNPDSPEPYLELGQLLEKDGRIPEAVAAFQQYLRLVPDNVTVVLYLGGVLYRAKDFAGAQTLFLQAKELSPADAIIDFWLGILAEERQDWPAAIRYFETVRQKDASSMILVRLSYYYSASKNFKKAVEYLQVVSRREPRNPNLHYLLGVAYLDMRAFKKADAQFRQVLEQRPDSVDAHFHQGVMYDQWGKFDKAVPAFERAIALDPRHAPSLNYLGYSFVDRGIRLEEAGALIRRALAEDPENGSYRDSLGWLFFKQGDATAAERELAAAVRSYPDPVIFGHLGDVYAALGRQEDAWNAYRESLARAPAAAGVRTKMEKLEQQMPATLFGNLLLKRAIENCRQVRALSAPMIISAGAGGASFRAAGSFLYVSSSSWRLDVTGGFLSPSFSVIAAPDVAVYPGAVARDLPPGQLHVFAVVAAWFNGTLLESFDQPAVVAAPLGKNVRYRLADRTLVLDRREDTVVEVCTPEYRAVFSEYHAADALRVPGRIRAAWHAPKFSADVRLPSAQVNGPVPPAAFEWTGQVP